MLQFTNGILFNVYDLCRFDNFRVFTCLRCSIKVMIFACCSTIDTSPMRPSPLYPSNGHVPTLFQPAPMSAPSYPTTGSLSSHMYNGIPLEQTGYGSSRDPYAQGFGARPDPQYMYAQYRNNAEFYTQNNWMPTVRCFICYHISCF